MMNLLRNMMGLLGNIAEVICAQNIANRNTNSAVSLALAHYLCINSNQSDSVAHLLNQVKACRRRLMSGPFVAEFSFLLDSGKDGIEVKALSPTASCPALLHHHHQTPVLMSTCIKVPR